VGAPGPVDTDYVPSEEHELVHLFRLEQHIKRNGTPKAVAEVVLFLTSAGSSFNTDQVIAVDGGLRSI
jgi:NAD(P)-dependent dehydrogenase (short-subunit alcohol dehydrogenase family)